MIENILILDTETTGLEPSKGAVLIEVGAILFNIKYREPIQVFSTLLSCEENPAQNINNIDPAWTRALKSETDALRFLCSMGEYSSYVVAHNAAFDRKFMITKLISYHFDKTPWICTQRDFIWPCSLVRHRLEDVCKGMGVPYTNAHRALTDCYFLSYCFKRCDDLEDRIIKASQKCKENTFR